MGIKCPRKSPRLLVARPVKTAVKAAETTFIPVDDAAGHYGAIAYFTVLCYPGVDARSHSRRDKLTVALLDYIRGIVKYRQSYKRVTGKRAASAAGRTEITWLREPARMKNSTVFAVGSRAEKILCEQRLTCASIANQLVMIQVSKDLERQRSAIQVKVGGPQILTPLIEAAAEKLGLAEVRTMWRYWRETLPVLHLATAFQLLHPKQQDGDRPELMVRCVRDHRLWLAKTVRSAEHRAKSLLPRYTTFEASNRICLLPE